MKKIISRLKENIEMNPQVYAFGLVAMCIIGLVFLMYKTDLNSKILTYTSHRSNQNEVQMVHDFTSGMEIQQKFSCYSDFDFITLNFSDHDQRLKGKMGILVYETDSENVVTYQEIDMAAVWYKVPVEIFFDEAGGGKANTEYEIKLFSTDTDDAALGVFGYKTENETATVNGEKSEYALSLGIHSYTSFYFNTVKIILGLAIVTIFVVTICAIRYKLKEETMFLLLTVPFVLSMLLLWPGNEVYDEGRHYHTVYYHTNALLGCGEEDNYTQIQMRKCDIPDNREMKELGLPINAQAQRYYYYYFEKMWDKAEIKEMSVVDISNLPVVPDGSFIQYTPGILGMSLARVLGANHFWMMTITRVAVIICYLSLCYYAIRKIPVLKIMIALVSALPMNLYQTSGISYDSVTFAVGIVVFSFVIKLWYCGLEKKEWILFGIFVFLLGNCKGGVYLTLILLMVFIPKEKYEQKKWFKFAGILGIAGVSMLSSFLPTIINWINMSVARNAGEEAPSAVINSAGVVAQKLSPMFVITNPVEFITMFVQTMIENMDIYLGQMLGYRTAWSSQAIHFVAMLPFLVLIIMAAINKEEENFKIGAIGKIGILSILLFELIGMQVIFLTETAVHYSTIIGFQGRYFILFLPCILLLFRNENLSYKGKIQVIYPMYSMAQLVYWYFFLRMFMLH